MGYEEDEGGQMTSEESMRFLENDCIWRRCFGGMHKGSEEMTSVLDNSGGDTPEESLLSLTKGIRARGYFRGQDMNSSLDLV